MLHSLGAHGGVARAVRKKQPIEGILREVIVPRHHGDSKPKPVDQVPGTNFRIAAYCSPFRPSSEATNYDSK